MKNYIYRLFVLLIPVLMLSCNNTSESQSSELTKNPSQYSQEDVELGDTAVPNSQLKNELQKYQPDYLINAAARFYAGLECDTTKITGENRIAWENYSKKIKAQTAICLSTLHVVDSLVSVDMKEMHNANYVFYPFSGPDFLYPVTLVPNADTYFLIGLERPGTINTNLMASMKYFDRYTKSLSDYMKRSYFITQYMRDDLSNSEIDGTIPVISMLMAINKCEIVSIKYKKIDNQGVIIDTNAVSKLVEFQFYNEKTPSHLQTLYYLSTNLENRALDKNFLKYCDTTLSTHKVVTFLKAASYILHNETFSIVRDFILNNSYAFLQDDSGIPYRFIKEDVWDITLFGKYMRPRSLFGDYTYQLDLLDKYNKTDSIKNLPIRIGYNRESNWLYAKKK